MPVDLVSCVRCLRYPLLSIIARMKVVATCLFLIFLLIIAIALPPTSSRHNVVIGGQKEQRELIERMMEKHERNQVLNVQQSLPSEGVHSRSIDLTVFVVFHNVLSMRMYEGIQWAHLTPISSSGSVLDTPTAVNTLVRRACMNRTSLFFLATNPQVKGKQYPKRDMLVKQRLLFEWLMPGYDGEHLGSTMHEYGAMLSVFRSNMTQHAGSFGSAKGAQVAVVADADGDGVQEWTGFFQYDMRIDHALLYSIRRRIVQKTRSVLRKGQLHCCIFYGPNYPTSSLLNTALGRYLLAEYNDLFGTSWALSDLPEHAITDAFVVPTVVFNVVTLYLEDLMHRAIRNISAFPVGRHGDGSSDAERRLEVAEAALALALGVAGTQFVFIQIPVRHERNVRRS